MTDLSQQRVPLVDYLSLRPRPHLVANECVDCGARFFDRRNACANCFGARFTKADIAEEGVVRAYSVVMVDAPGVPVPYVPAVIDCGGTSVRANLVGLDHTDRRLGVGLKVRLTTFPIGTDEAGTVGVGFGFEPMGAVRQ
jgi:uncharacterized OB-fold protein